MKNIFTIFLLLVIFSSCNAQSLKIKWTAAGTADQDSVQKYTVYVFQGDSLQWQNFKESDLDSVGTLLHINGDLNRVYVFPFVFTEQKIIRAAIKAEDKLTRRSGFAFTRFYFWPNYPKEVWIAK